MAKNKITMTRKCKACGDMFESHGENYCDDCCSESACEDSDEETVPDYWMCYSCGYNTGKKPDGFGCPRCTSTLSPEYF